MSTESTDAAYLAAQGPTFEPAVSQAVRGAIRERAPDPVLRIGEQLLQTSLAGDGGPLLPSSTERR